MHRIDGAGNQAGMFVHEDAATSRPPTEFTADWANAVQEELIAVIQAAGLVLDKVDNAQLLAALSALFAPYDVLAGLNLHATTTAEGMVELATTAEAVAGVDTIRAVTPSGLAAAIDDALAGMTGGGLGEGQTWQDVSGSRALDTTYQNTSGKPIMMSIVLTGGASFSVQTMVDTVTPPLQTIGNEAGNLSVLHVSTVIPANSYYQVTVVSGSPSVSSWAELR